jgi:translation elongation factor EF-1alpha
VDWSQQRFTDIRDKLRLFLTKQVHLDSYHPRLLHKLDTMDWSQQRFTDIRDKLKLFLTKQVHLIFNHLCS